MARKNTSSVISHRGVVSESWSAHLCSTSALIVGILLSIFALYYQTLSFDIVRFDDHIFLESQQVVPKNLSSIIGAFKTPTFVQDGFYRPMLGLSLLMDKRGDIVVAPVCHQTNLVLHLLTAVLVFLLLIQLNVNRFLSFGFGVLFGVHPLLVSAVAWIPGRNDVLLAFFTLLSLLSLIKYFKTQATCSRAVFLLLSWITFAGALFTKESAAVLPVLFLLLLPLVLKQRIIQKKVLWLSCGWGVLIAIGISLRAAALANVPIKIAAPWAAFLKNAPAFFCMIGKVVLPNNLFLLSFIEPLSLIVGICVVFGLFALFFFSKRVDKKILLFGAFWFLSFFLPSLFVRQYLEDYHYDYLEHRMYLPIIGLLVIGAHTLNLFKETLAQKKLLFLMVGIVFLFGIRSWLYLPTFRDANNFWNQALQVYPQKDVGYIRLAKLFMDKGDRKSAEEYLIRALKVDSNHYLTYQYLSDLYLLEGRYDESRKNAQKAVELHPVGWDGYFALAKAYAGMKQFQKAREVCLFSLKIVPKTAPFYIGLGYAYFSIGDLEMSEKAWTQALGLAPQNAENHLRLIVLYATTEQKSKALKTAENFVRSGGRLPAEIAKLLK